MGFSEIATQVYLSVCTDDIESWVTSTIEILLNQLCIVLDTDLMANTGNLM